MGRYGFFSLYESGLYDGWGVLNTVQGAKIFLCITYRGFLLNIPFKR